MGFIKKVLKASNGFDTVKDALDQKPQKQKPSAQDIAAAEFAAYRQNLQTEVGDPLRIRQIEQAMDPELEARENNFFSGRANADVAAAEKASFDSLRRESSATGVGLKNRTAELASRGTTLAQAGVEAKTAAKQYSQARADERRMNAQKTGEQLGNLTQNTMSGLAASENNRNIQELYAKQREDESRAAMWGDIAMSAGMLAYDRYRPKPKSLYDGTVAEPTIAPVELNPRLRRT